MDELDREEHITANPPNVMGAVLVVPRGLIDKMQGKTSVADLGNPVDTQASAARARNVIMEVERSLGFEPVDREFERLGYDIESRDPETGKLRFLEVKGRISGASTITVTKNEILYSLNKPDDYILAIVEFLSDTEHRVHYVRRPFSNSVDFHVTEQRSSLSQLIEMGSAPS